MEHEGRGIFSSIKSHNQAWTLTPYFGATCDRPEKVELRNQGGRPREISGCARKPAVDALDHLGTTNLILAFFRTWKKASTSLSLFQNRGMAQTPSLYGSLDRGRKDNSDGNRQQQEKIVLHLSRLRASR